MKVIIFVSALVLAANAAPSNFGHSNVLVRVDDASIFGNSEPVYHQPQETFRLESVGGSSGGSGGGYSVSQPIQSRSYHLSHTENEYSDNSGGGSGGYSAPAQTITLRRVGGSAPSGGSYGYAGQSSYSQPASYTLRAVGTGGNGGYNGGQQYTSQSSGGYSHTYADEGSKPLGSEYIDQVLGLINRQ